MDSEDDEDDSSEDDIVELEEGEARGERRASLKDKKRIKSKNADRNPCLDVILIFEVHLPSFYMPFL